MMINRKKCPVCGNEAYFLPTSSGIVCGICNMRLKSGY